MGLPHRLPPSGPASLTLKGPGHSPDPAHGSPKSQPAFWDGPVTRALKGTLGNMTESDGSRGWPLVPMARERLSAEGTLKPRLQDICAQRARRQTSGSSQILGSNHDSISTRFVTLGTLLPQASVSSSVT